jgi:hypothetical protein
MAEALAPARRILLAALLAAVQQKAGKRLGQPSGSAVELERGLADEAA